MPNKFILFIPLIILFAFTLNGQNCKPNKITALQKQNNYVHSSKININNISTWVYNNNKNDVDQTTGKSGFEFPILSGKTAIYQTGVMWGGKVNGSIRVGGSYLKGGITGGKLLGEDIAEDPNNEKVRIFKVRRDFKTANLLAEAEDENIEIELVYANYQKDWNEWPGNTGAPYEDIDMNGIYSPEIDIPGIPGADQTLWYVGNDLDSNLTKNITGSLPMGIEVQITIWGYNTNNFLQNIIFKKYKLINKSKYDFDEMFLGIWSDPDVGNPINDFSGCDTLLHLGYAYNGTPNDQIYGVAPAAIGYQVLDGPYNKNNEKLLMTSFGHFSCGDFIYSSPGIGNYENGTLEWYNLFHGLTSSGSKVINPINSMETKFTLSGDPLTGEGWLGNTLRSCGDASFIMSAGPFILGSGESCEYVFAQIGAIGKNRLNAVRILKYYARLLQENYNNLSAYLKYEQVEYPETDNPASNKNGIQLSWSDVSLRPLPEGYDFEGYNVYQFYSEDFLIENTIKLATFDVVNGITSIQGIKMNDSTGMPESRIVQEGTDSGLQFSYFAEDDKTLNQNFVRGKEYYFGITGYAYNMQSGEVIESKISKINIIYEDGENGPVYNQVIGVESIGGKGGLKVIPIVKNDQELKQHEYMISIEKEDSELKWKLTDQTSNTVLLTNLELYDYPSYDSDKLLHPIVDGMEIQVYKLRQGFEEDGKGIVEIKYSGEPIPEYGWDETGYNYTGNSVWRDPNWEGPNSNHDRFYVSNYWSEPNFWEVDSLTSDCELRFNDNVNFGLFHYNQKDDRIINVPFEIWNIGSGTPNDISDDFRMIPLFSNDYKEEDPNEWRYAVNTDRKLNYPSSDGIDFYNPVVKTPGDHGYRLFADACIRSGGAGSIYNEFYSARFENLSILSSITICDYDLDGNPPPSGTVIRFNLNKLVTVDDKITFSSPVSGISKNDLSDLPNEFLLDQNYPNPFNPSTKIKFALSKGGYVRIDLFNILGQRVYTLINQNLSAGNYEKEFFSRNLSSGVYIYRFQVDNRIIDNKKMILLK